MIWRFSVFFFFHFFHIHTHPGENRNDDVIYSNRIIYLFEIILSLFYGYLRKYQHNFKVGASELETKRPLTLNFFEKYNLIFTLYKVCVCFGCLVASKTGFVLHVCARKSIRITEERMMQQSCANRK